MTILDVATNSNKPITVDITRGSIVESKHLVDVLVMNAEKKILASHGDIYESIYPRSSIKLLQALLLVESGAYSALGLELQHLALASSSHLADKIHTDLVHEWLQKLNLTEENLRCGAHAPGRDDVRALLLRQNLEPHRGHNNCSGKHCGILSVCKHKNYKLQNYDSFDHPIQKDLMNLLSEVYEYDLTNSPFGIDGCGIPTIAVPLYNLTLGYTNFIKRESGKLILEALAKYPELISGDGNLCTEVIRATKGRVIAKTGAEGVFCAFSPVHDIFISLKVRDGGSRASHFAIIALLKEYGCFLAEEESILEKFLNPKIKNWEGVVVGEIKFKGIAKNF
jgi:L-asparaginase II